MLKKKITTIVKKTESARPIPKEAPSVEIVSMDSIHLWSENPRKNDKAVKPLAKLLEAHGQKTPLVVWKKNKTIYKGNTTYKAAKQLGWKSIWVAYVDFKNDEEAVAYALADNKSSEWSEWDEAVLSMLIPRSFKGQEWSSVSAITGFKETDLASYLIPIMATLPDTLPEVDMQGVGIDSKSDYLVLQFDSHAEMEDFRGHFDTKKHPRVIPFKMLTEKMEWKKASGVQASSEPSTVVQKKRMFKMPF